MFRWNKRYIFVIRTNIVRWGTYGVEQTSDVVPFTPRRRRKTIPDWQRRR